MIRYADPISWVTNFLVIGFIVFYFASQFGLIGDYTIRDYNYQDTKNLINTCEIEHNDLIDLTNEFNELKDTDIHRAYTECREDLSDEKTGNDAMWFWWAILTVVLVTVTHTLTKEHYQTKSKKNKK